MIDQHHLQYSAISIEETYHFKKELINLAVVSYGLHAPVLAPDHAEAMKKNLLNEEMWDLLVSHSQCFVCMHDKNPVGMAYLIPSGNPWKFFEVEWSYIRMVGVLPGYEGMGIGRKLTSMCVEHARVLGEQTVALHTSDFMDAARHIYESMGFTILKEIESQWGKRYWIYTLNLFQSSNQSKGE
jgi:ribosomal protein S18 acetylase RimI-like enzyme